jgi:hypothetical protein
MSTLDKSASGQIIPRFLGYADNRDFFLCDPARERGQTMRISQAGVLGAITLACLALFGHNSSFQEQNEALFRELQGVHALSDAQMSAIRKIFARSGYIGQGNPAIARHPMTREEAQVKLNRLGISYANPRFERICGAKYVAPLYNLATQRPEDAKACIDQFEFPDIPTAYPVVWVKAREAAEICWAM